MHTNTNAGHVGGQASTPDTEPELGFQAQHKVIDSAQDNPHTRNDQCSTNESVVNELLKKVGALQRDLAACERSRQQAQTIQIGKISDVCDRLDASADLKTALIAACTAANRTSPSQGTADDAV